MPRAARVSSANSGSASRRVEVGADRAHQRRRIVLGRKQDFAWLGHRCSVGETWFRLYWPRLPPRSCRILARRVWTGRRAAAAGRRDVRADVVDRRWRLRRPLDRVGARRAPSPDARVVVLEASTCGAGPSGRNAGFVNGFWHRAHLLCEHFGDDAAREVCVRRGRVGGGDRRLGRARGDRHRLSPGRAPEGRDERRPGRGLGRGGRAPARASDPRRRVRAGATTPRPARRCASPLFRGGAWMPDAATVQPARLALGAARRPARARGARSTSAPARARSGPRPAAGSWSETAPGRGSARRPAVLADQRRHRRDPPPALAARGELDPHDRHRAGPRRARRARLDRRRGDLDRAAVPPLLPHHRRRRIAFGGGGGVLAYGARLGGRVELDVGAAVPELRDRDRALLPGPPRSPDRRGLGRPGRRLADPPAVRRQPRRGSRSTTSVASPATGSGPRT